MRKQISRLASTGLLVLLASCGGGGSSDSPGPTPPAGTTDTTPAAFSFPEQNGTALSSGVTSNAITVAGINASTPVSITGGEYSIDGGPFSSAPGTVTAGQAIRVRVTTSSQFSTPAVAVLTIGGISASFTAITLPPDHTPESFQFQKRFSETRSSWVTSDVVTLAGIDANAPISIENGEYAIGGGAFTSAAGTISAGQSLTIRARASGTYAKLVRARVTVGTFSTDFEITSEATAYVPDSVVHDGQDVIYLLSNAHRLIFKWSIAEARYLDSYPVGVGIGPAPTEIAYSNDHQRLYVGYSTGAIRYIDVTGGGQGAEIPFANLPMSVNGLAAVGTHVLAQDDADPWETHYVINRNGVITDREDWNYYSREYAWDPVTSRVYFFRDNQSPNDLHFEVIDQVTGTITAEGETPYHGAYTIAPPIRVSPNGQHVLLGSGDIYSQASLTWSGAVGSQVTDARWFADNSLVTLSTANNQTTLRRVGTNLVTQEQLTYTGQALRVLGMDARMAVLVVNNGAVQFHTYVPNNDSDGDGVSNIQDAFPLDRAASADTDRDGYPDAWNAGRSQSDSTTGLSLDSFPQDSACYLPSHGSGGVCNYGATIPNYVPDQVVSHGDIVYLLSNANRRVYRWSIATGQYLNPYVVGINEGFSTLAPTKIAYSSSHQRLYLGYSTGAIQYVDVTSGAAEVPFANIAQGMAGLAAVGNYVLAQGSGFAGTHYVINASGVITDQSHSAYYSGEYAWDPVNSRVYFFRDNVSPNDLHFEVVNQTTGTITSVGETPYHGSYNITAPIRVSTNGQYVLLGSGDIYNQSGLTWAGSLGSQATDARWFADGSIVTLTTVGNQTVLRRVGTNLATLELLTYTGPVRRVVGTDARMALVLIDNSTVQFQIYVPSNDSDGDGVPNTQDAFPLDPAASVDTDGDGYPDAWNAGRTQSDSTTGLNLDAFPQDSACYLGSHNNGSGGCNYGATIPNYVPDQVLNDGDIVYLLSSANKRVYRWSMTTGQYLNPYVVGINQGFSTLAPTKMAYSSSHHRLYLAYSTGAIRYIDVTGGSAAEVPFSTTAMAASNIAAVGNYLLAEDGSGAWGTHYIFNSNGVITDSEEWNYHSPEYAWDPVNSRAYFFRDHSPSDLHYEVVNQTTGQITSEGETPYHGSYLIATPIRVSANGQYILLGSGDIYNQSGLTWARSLGSVITDARWFANGSLVTLSTANNQTTLRRRGSNLGTLEQLTYTGSALRVVGSDTRMAVLVIHNSTVQFHIYEPNDDTDGDGVNNTADAFPHDPAASVDTDRDGHPDAWNAGRSESDSTTGLTLDAYPQDSACYLGSHGSGGICTPSATVPNYVPDQIVSHGDIVYLLSRANNRVYRWSIADEEYLNPYVVGTDEGFSNLAPTKMAYSSNHQRLYLGYSTGVIQYMDVTVNNGPEVPFANTAMAVNGLAAVGNFVMAQDDSGAWESHYVFNSSGVVTDLEEWNYYSSDYAWDPVTSRVYFFRDNQSPGDLLYEVVDQVTGAITSEGETPYHGSYGTQPPIRVSTNGQYVLLGTGDIYNQVGLTWAGSLGSRVTDARWFADGSLVTLSTGNSQTTLRRRGTNLANLEQLVYAGQALRVVGGDAKMAVLVSNGSTVQFHIYVPNNDSDGDGVLNTEDAFALDPAASVDSDNDGYPNAWNAGMSQSDSTTGLSLDAFPQDSACYLSSHGSGGVCNYGATIPEYVPDQVVNHGDTVYLLSSANSRVYRWSIATGQYLNPYIVGIDQGFSTIAPTKMAYSSAHQRLYLGYSTGAIQYIDVQASSPAEVPFSNTAMGVNGLASVGSYVLAQDGSGAWATHYVINSSGVITDQADWNYYSRDYAWDPVTWRVYFFRDGMSPNDLHFEFIDQNTGQIMGAGETPYHGSYNILPPIRVSPNGQQVLLGSGDIYNQNGLTYAGSLSRTLADAHWKGNLLVDVATTDLVEIRNASSRAVLASYQYMGLPIRLVFGQTEAYLVHVVNNTTEFTRLPFGDQDSDSIPKWWEELYGLSDSNPADALGDLDGDGVNNRDEYLNNTNPVGG